MNRILMAAVAAAALSLPVTASFAAADGTVIAANDRHHDRGHHRGHVNQDRGDQNWNNDNRQPDAWRGSNPNAFVGHPHWSRGDRLYHSYWSQDNYVDDWRGNHLRRPPHGYRWVRVDNNFVLVAITTGIILDVMEHN